MPMSHDDTAAVVAPTGELDISNIDDLRADLFAAAYDSDVVITDLTDVAYIDSSTVTVLLDVTNAMRSKRGELRVVAPAGGRPRRVLEVSGVDSTLSLYGTLDDARCGTTSAG